MSFTLRQVTHRAGGGEIVRTRPIDAAEPVIGRGADCDIHLPDLAVSLRHARLSAIGPGRVHVESLGEAAFEVGSRFRRAADLAITEAPTIVLGRHVLTFTAGEAADEVVVAVARMAGADRAPVADDERAIFAPTTAMFGRRRLAWTFGLGILLACLALPMAAFFANHRPASIYGGRLHADRQWSSGPLSKAHGFLGNRCQACHQHAFVAVRDDACLSCHAAARGGTWRPLADIDKHEPGGPWPIRVSDHAAHPRLLAASPLPSALVSRITALFSRAFNHPNDRCASCHLEHLSADARTPAKRGLAGPARAVPFLITVNSCTDCHARLTRRLPATTLLNVPDWGRHPDFRPILTLAAGPHPRLRRVSLELNPIEHPGLIFSHRVHLLPNGGVARMARELGAARGYGPPLACANCHRPASDGRGFSLVKMKTDCAACHSLAFAGGREGLQFLPHDGSVGDVFETLKRFYAARAPAPPRPPAAGRRLPGLAAEIARAWRPPPAAPSIQAARAIRATFDRGGVCSYCHTIERPRDGMSLAYSVAPVRLAVRYLPRGGFDHGVPAHHQDAQGAPTCGACHGARLSDSASDVLLPRIARCAACHGAAKAQKTTAASAACAECHAYHAPGEPTSRRVARDWIRQGRPDRTGFGLVRPATISWARTPMSIMVIDWNHFQSQSPLALSVTGRRFRPGRIVSRVG